MLRKIFVVGYDGKTAWQRARGTPCSLKLVQLGEIARYKCRSKEGELVDQVTFGVLVCGWAFHPEQVSTSCLTLCRAGSATLDC